MPLKPVRYRITVLVAAAGVGLLSWGLAKVSAQTVNSSTIQSVLQSLGTTTSTGQAGVPAATPPINVAPAVSSSSQTLTPAVPPTAAQLPPSTLELVFSQRAGQPLQQYGYETFGVPSPVTITQIGGVEDRYILGPGDQLSIVCRGHDNNSYVVSVDRDGRLIVPNYEPVQAAGRTFAQVRQDLQAIIAKDALSTRAYVTLAQTRQISVLVSGEVNAPGLRTLSGLNTPIDALLLSGGIRKTGSLRNIVLVRGTKRIRIDLYSVLAHGASSEIGNLTDGDRIEVAPIGATVAAIGMVNRPAIYELPPGSDAIDDEVLLKLAGGKLPGANHLAKIALEPTGRMVVVPAGRGGVVRRGELLSVDQQAGGVLGQVTLIGAVQLQGSRALAEAGTLSRLIRDPGDLAINAYTPLGIIVHREPGTNFRRAKAFSLQRLFDGQEDDKLGDGDVVFVMTSDQAKALAAASAAQMQAAAQAANVPPSVLGQALSASAAQAAQAASQTSLTASPLGTSVAPVNNAASIYASAGSGTAPASPASTSSTAAASPAPTTAGQAIAAGVGQAIAGLSPTGVPAPGATAPATPSALPMTGLMSAAPLPPIAPYQAAIAAAASQKTPATIALLQAQNAQSVAAGIPLQGGGLTSPSALGSPAPDTNPADIAAELGLTAPALINFGADYLVWIVGDLHDPGIYLAEDGTPLSTMLGAAGGLQLQADLSAITVTSTELDPASGTSHTLRNAYRGTSARDFAKVALRPLDTVIVRQVFSDRETGTVTIVGQVRYPGAFDIMRNERLSSVLGRAGGLTDQAYPLGAVFTRISAQQTEAEGNYREAVELQSGALVAATTPNVNPSILTYLQTLQQTLLHQPALGRITVTADPTILAVKPELDVLMQPGDFIYVPKRPSTISVSGEVLNPGSFQYRSDMSADDYVGLAGGYTQTAEDSETFIILPDGSARAASSNMFDFFGNDPIPPGSTIVVPPNPAPFNTMVFLTSLSQIFSQVAIAAASLAVISHSNGS